VRWRRENCVAALRAFRSSGRAAGTLRIHHPMEDIGPTFGSALRSPSVALRPAEPPEQRAVAVSNPQPKPLGGGRRRWALSAFTRMNIGSIVVRNQIEEELETLESVRS
jgi:hypothetical protein